MSVCPATCLSHSSGCAWALLITQLRTWAYRDAVRSLLALYSLVSSQISTLASRCVAGVLMLRRSLTVFVLSRAVSLLPWFGCKGRTVLNGSTSREEGLCVKGWECHRSSWEDSKMYRNWSQRFMRHSTGSLCISPACQPQRKLPSFISNATGNFSTRPFHIHLWTSCLIIFWSAACWSYLPPQLSGAAYATRSLELFAFNQFKWFILLSPKAPFLYGSI